MSEFVSPSPEQSEIEAQGVALAQEIAELRSRARSDEDYQIILEKTQALKSLFGIGSTEMTDVFTEAEIEQAKEILGADFIGPDEVKAAFLDQVEISTVPPIPFSKEELERARDLGQMLILRVNQAKDGTDLTMEKIHGLMDGKIKDEAKVLYKVDWYKDEDFYKKDKPAVSWALVSKEVVQESSNKNYLEQAEVLANYLKTEVFKDKEMPAEYAEAIAEFETAKAGIAAIVESDDETKWKEAGRRLEALKLTQLTRQTPAEALYDVVVYYQHTGQRLLEGNYTWTARRASDGRLVNVGLFDAVGAIVGRDGPGSRYGFLGVSFSRSR